VRLRQILTNLVGNAVKFTEQGGVRILASQIEVQERHFLRFEVRDTGVGVPEQKRQEIFEEFVQADSSHARRFGGSGLGLAISKRLVEAMGGQIGIDPAPGGGSAFWFTLPARVAGAAPGTTPLADIRIAIVTDNSALLDGLTAQIEAAGGQVASLSRNSQNNFGIDAILIDAGTDLDPDPPAHPDLEIPALALVTPAARGKLTRLRAMGFAGYLVKPVRQASLVERILTCRGFVPRPVSIDDYRPAEEIGPQDLTVRPQNEIAFQAPPPMSAEAPPLVPPMPVGSLRILLAEDNPINAMLIRELLRRRSHAVTEVTNGMAAVKAMAENSFDLLLTDIHMPGMDGIEAAREIRAFETKTARARTPIVALTADALETGKRACQDAGMDGFLTKPVDPAELDAMFEMFFGSESRPRHFAA
jgi:CheY-like chemotaxis protein